MIYNFFLACNDKLFQYFVPQPSYCSPLQYFPPPPFFKVLNTYLKYVSLCTLYINNVKPFFIDKMAHRKKLPLILLVILSIGFLSNQINAIAVMSIDLGSEWIKIAIVSVNMFL
jgi:hypothetical protein